MNDQSIRRGDLFVLWYPGTRFTFSGYGLALEAGRKDLLVGLVIVDRPQPVSSVWLDRVKWAFGDYELYPMTVDQERGIVCRMRIAPESLALVSTLDHPLTAELRAALLPLLSLPPNPCLYLHWEVAESLWQSTLDLEGAGSGDDKSQTTGAVLELTATRQQRFALGDIVATTGAIDALSEADSTPITFLERHVTGDWGDLCEEDRQANEYAVGHGVRVFSSYRLPTGTKLWVITEHDRSVTTLLLPSEY